jgi:hypothetical protein
MKLDDLMDDVFGNAVADEQLWKDCSAVVPAFPRAIVGLNLNSPEFGKIMDAIEVDSMEHGKQFVTAFINSIGRMMKEILATH